MKALLNLLIPIILFACKNEPPEMPADPADPVKKAAVLSAEVSGTEENYIFSVEVESPDTGCDQYADWWEIIDREGNLKYRRVLLHSHVNEQPFTRSGGPVPVRADEFVYIRAHMNTSGFGTEVLSGTVAGGFTTDRLDEDFAKEVENQDPLPEDCDF